MANTYVDYTGNGSETDFNFSFPYIKTSHVVVEVNEGQGAGGLNKWVRKTLTTDYSVQTSPSTFVRFVTAPAANVRVRVLRDSDASTGIVDFANGSVLTETELDNSYEHNRYLAEEAEEGITGGALVKNTDGQFDADGLRLENLADPDSDDDAVNKGYADTRFVNVTGDTMTGGLAMSNNNITGVNSVQGLATPASDNHAANKKYVDDEVAAEAAARVTNDALQVTKAGDSMSGNLTMTSPAKVIQNQAPTSGDDLTNKTYVDNATTTLTNDKVSKSGDTMTGALTLPDADPSNGNHATRKTYVDAQIATTLATGVAGGPIDTVNIADDAVTFAKMQDINSGNVIGRNIRTPADTGDPEEVPILDEDDMTSDSNTSLATQQSIKAYVDGAVSGVGGEDNVQADWAETDSNSDAFIQNKPSLSTVATSGSYNDLSGTPTLSTVATSGLYSDLSGTPTIPTNNNELINGAGYTTNTGTVTEVDAGTGLETSPGAGITDTGTIGISAGGVGTTELANNAVTSAKISSTDTTLNVNDSNNNIGTGALADSNYQLTVDGGTTKDTIYAKGNQASAYVDLDLENESATGLGGRVLIKQGNNIAAFQYQENGERVALNVTDGSLSATAGITIACSTGSQAALKPSGSMYSNPNSNVDLGASSNTWDNGYINGGAWTGSDRNLKQDIEDLSEAELRVATALKGLMKKFRLKDAVVKKGDDARIHIGVIAQDVKAAFEAEGLDAYRYAIIGEDTWWSKQDEDGEWLFKNEETSGYTKHTKMSVRYEQLLAFIISSL